MIVRANPGLKRELRIAHIPKTADQFVKQKIIFSLYFAIGISALVFFGFFGRLKSKPMIIPILVLSLVVSFVFILIFNLQTPKGLISKRKKEIDREVLFTGRYLLVKMDSGSPLFNSLIDASKSFNVSAKYFREIVEEINTGTPLEDAIEIAREYNASEKFKKILWQILAALKTGTEVTNALRSTLKSIANEQMTEIREYGKKLNSLMLFYMVMACIVPSLGVSLFIIIASFIQLEIQSAHLFTVLFGIFAMQLMFIIIIRASRPTIEL